MNDVQILTEEKSKMFTQNDVDNFTEKAKKERTNGKIIIHIRISNRRSSRQNV